MPEPQARRTNRVVTVIGLILAFAMSAMEATVVSTAMPSVVGDLGRIELYAWVTTAYLLTSSVTVPIYGKLADVFGRKPVLLFGILVFLLGSAASGLSSSMAQLIFFRALQGVGAGAIQPIGLTVVGDIFDLSERSRIQGVFGAAWGFFGLTGPRIGSFLVEHLSWRWIFLINVPFGLIAAVLVVFAFHERVERRTHRLDYLGALLLTSGLTALLLATSHVIPGAAGWAYPLSALLLVAFVAVERRAAEPVLPLSLFTRRVILVSSVAGTIIGGAMMVTVTFVPLFVRGVLRETVENAGIAFTPMLVGWPIASTLGGRLIPRVGFRPLIWVGLAITAGAAAALALFGQGGGVARLQIITGAFGVGMGFANTALLIAVQTSVAWEQRGIATASTSFFRTIGGALAVSVTGGVLNAAIGRDPTISPELASRVLRSEGVRGLDPALLDRVASALGQGVGSIFWIVAAMAVGSFVASLWFPYVPTRTEAEVVPSRE
jgi:EmrB/QacA subfamily drug resistance transporter